MVSASPGVVWVTAQAVFSIDRKLSEAWRQLLQVLDRSIGQARMLFKNMD